jgi:hypothetical protein
MSNEDIAKSMGDMASSVKEYKESILRYLEDPKIDSNSKFVFERIIRGSFEAISQLYRFESFNTRMIYDLKHAINKLPEWREFDEMKNIVNDSNRIHEEDRQFIQKAKRYFEDLSKDVEGKNL